MFRKRWAEPDVQRPNAVEPDEFTAPYSGHRLTCALGGADLNLFIQRLVQLNCTVMKQHTAKLDAIGDRNVIDGTSAGKLPGRPKGALGKSGLDGKEQDIRVLLGKNVSKTSIAKILDVSRSALYHFIETRKIVPS